MLDLLICRLALAKAVGHSVLVLVTGVLLLIAIHDTNHMMRMMLIGNRQARMLHPGDYEESELVTGDYEENVLPTSDYDTRVLLTGDVYEAGHSRSHPELCPKQGASLSLLILVSSAPNHKMKRQAIRYTWGNVASRSDVAVAFMLGAPEPTSNSSLHDEDVHYRDIIVGNSIDSYSNLTLKTLSMLEWVAVYCPRVPRLLKTDDDVFVNVWHLLHFVSSPEHANASRVVWGKVCHGRRPVRRLDHKCYLSPVQFPASMLPDYTAGAAYLLTTDTVQLLLAAARQEPYVRMEDVFLTGVLAAKIGVRRQHVPRFNVAMRRRPCAVQRVIAVRNVAYHSQFRLWYALSYPSTCMSDFGKV